MPEIADGVQQQLERLRIVLPRQRPCVRVLDPACVETGALDGGGGGGGGGFGITTAPEPAPRSDAEKELDACAAAHVRWATADQMRVAATLRLATTLDVPSVPWRTLIGIASHAEDALLRGRAKLLARPCAAALAAITGSGAGAGAGGGAGVRLLGVSARYAALLCPAAPDDPAAPAAAPAAAAEPATAPADCVHVCELSRASDLAWKRAAATLPRRSVRGAALYGAELLLCGAAESEAGPDWLAVLALPECERSTFAARLRPDTAQAPSAATLGQPSTAVAFGERFVACAHGRTLEVWRRSGPGGAEQHAATPPRWGFIMPHTTHGADAHAVYEHDADLVAVALDACTSAGSRMLVCSDARGRLLFFRLAEVHEGTPASAVHSAPPLVLPPFVVAPGDAAGPAADVARLLRADEPVRVLAVAGSRLVFATATRLLICDRERTPGPGLPPGGGRNGTIMHAIECAGGASGAGDLGGLGAPIALALWGEAIVVHDAAQRIAVVDARPGRVAKAYMGEKLRAGVPAHAADAPLYQGVAAACDQAGVLLSNGTLMMLDIEA